MNRSSDALIAEELRIRKAYARRNNQHIYSRFSPGYLFMVQTRERYMLKLLSNFGYATLKDKKILEIGCGTGDLLRDFVKWGARPENIKGMDLLADRVSEANQLCPRGLEIVQGDAAHLRFSDASFDLVLQSTVFTSVLDAGMKRLMAAEMLRVLKQHGLILWYDYHMNNPRNPDVRGVRLREIRELFPECNLFMRRTTLAPPLSRWLARHSLLLCDVLEKIPWLCTHYIGVIRKN
jgi:ubiquinone/menaquinone biosynthesis C-methylase UbiE